MRKVLVALCVLVVLTMPSYVMAGSLSGNKVMSKAEKKEEALNQKRIKDAIVMGKMIEYFYKKTGKYPLAPKEFGDMVTVIITKNKEFVPKNTIPYDKLQKELFDVLGNKAVLAMDPADNKKELGRVYRYKTNGQDYWFAVYLTKEREFTKTAGTNLYKLEITSRQRGDKLQYKIKTIKRFLKYGKDDKRMQKSLAEALENEMYDWALELLSQGANINPACGIVTDCQPLAIAAKEGNIEKIKFLLKYGADINGLNAYGNTPIMVALENNHIDAAKFLVEAGADVNIANTKAITPFIVAILLKNYDLVNLMLEKGADVNKRYMLLGGIDNDTKVGVRPLEAAVQTQDTKLVKLLIEKGANPNAKTAKGADLIEYAKSLPNKDIVAIIEKAISSSLK